MAGRASPRRRLNQGPPDSRVNGFTRDERARSAIGPRVRHWRPAAHAVDRTRVRRGECHARPDQPGQPSQAAKVARDARGAHVAGGRRRSNHSPPLGAPTPLTLAPHHEHGTLPSPTCLCGKVVRRHSRDAALTQRNRRRSGPAMCGLSSLCSMVIDDRRRQQPRRRSSTARSGRGDEHEAAMQTWRSRDRHPR